MDNREAKLALARKKLKDHQEKKLCGQRIDIKSEINLSSENLAQPTPNIDVDYHHVPAQDAIESIDSIQSNVTEHITAPGVDNYVTEILISNKRNLETQVHNLQVKLAEHETNQASIINNFKLCTDKVTRLENELQNINNMYETATKEIIEKDSKIYELNALKLSLTDEKCNLIEQIEFTKTVLSAKEAENDSLHCQLYNLQNQYDVLQLQLQQLTNGLTTPPPGEKAVAENNLPLLHKIATLEQQISLLQKERDQINLHYEHYVAELNEQLMSMMKKNELLTVDVQSLSNRENSLIEQISDMEIRIQNYNKYKEEIGVQQNSNINNIELQDDFRKVQEDLGKLRMEHEELQKQYAECIIQIKDLNEVKVPEYNQDNNISLSKLNADMTSDKIAAQRATEQNKKLKQDLQRLEDAFVKMSKDKLDLTEKITAEKYLNRELTIKLAEIDEKSKDMQSKLKAKDEEMIRLQMIYRIKENECEQLKQFENNCTNDSQETKENNEEDEHVIEPDNASQMEHKLLIDDKISQRIRKEDAMLKLQARFLKIMEEVADLSDEKHRLEHIILQLQNETDTICEYVALYQQQRSLLKRRDEERTAQLKLFQQECGKLKCQLEELSIILMRFADDKELSSYFLNESKNNDIQKVMNLLSDLKNNSLIDPIKKSVDFKNFYPCNCCSGKLIDV